MKEEDKERDHIERWRLILGQTADPGEEIELSADEKGMDRVLNALYDSDRQGGLEIGRAHV